MGGHVESSAIAALVAVGRPVVVVLCGAFLAKYRATAGGAGGWKDLARITAEFLLPCLVIASFTSGVTPAVLVELWPVVALSFLLPCLWLAVGALGGWLLFSPRQQKFVRFAAVTVAYPNALALPIALLPALTREVPWLREREDAQAFGATVCMLFSLFLLLQVWTVGFAIYGAAAESAVPPPCKAAGASGKGEGATTCASHQGSPGQRDLEEAAAGDDGAASDGSTAATAEEAPGPTEVADPSFGQKLGHYINKAAENCLCAVREILNPLMLSLLLALAIAVSPIRAWFVGSVVHDTLKTVGSAAVPLILVQLGAGMARPPQLEADADGLHQRTAVAIVALRLVVANAAGSALVAFFRRAGWLEDRLVTLCMYLVCCAPTAANLGLVASVQQAFVQPTAVVLFFMQIASVLTMTVSIAVYVELLS